MSNGAVTSNSASSQGFFLVKWGRALARWFRGPKRRDPVPLVGLFSELDLDDVRSDLRPRQYGQEAGSDNVPHSDAVGLDAVEKNIAALVLIQSSNTSSFP